MTRVANQGVVKAEGAGGAAGAQQGGPDLGFGQQLARRLHHGQVLVWRRDMSGLWWDEGMMKKMAGGLLPLLVGVMF